MLCDTICLPTPSFADLRDDGQCSARGVSLGSKSQMKAAHDRPASQMQRLALGTASVPSMARTRRTGKCRGSAAVEADGGLRRRGVPPVRIEVRSVPTLPSGSGLHYG